MRKHDIERYLRRESARGLSRPAKAVYRVLLVCAKSDSGTLRFERVGDKRFKDDTGYGRTSVKAARRELVEAGLLEVLEVGDGRARSRYRVVLEATAYEHELYDEQLAQLPMAAGAEGLAQPAPSDPHRVAQRPPGGRALTPPTRARPGLSGLDRPYPPGQGPATGEADGLRPPEVPSPASGGATRCPTAASRGKPCPSCRACGTNPRAQRAAAAQTRVIDLFAGAPPPEERVATNARGLELARATLAARAAPSGHDRERAGPPDPPSPPGGGP